MADHQLKDLPARDIRMLYWEWGIPLTEKSRMQNLVMGRLWLDPAYADKVSGLQPVFLTLSQGPPSPPAFPCLPPAKPCVRSSRCSARTQRWGVGMPSMRGQSEQLMVMVETLPSASTSSTRRFSTAAQVCLHSTACTETELGFCSTSRDFTHATRSRSNQG